MMTDKGPRVEVGDREGKPGIGLGSMDQVGASFLYANHPHSKANIYLGMSSEGKSEFEIADTAGDKTVDLP